MDVAGVAEFLSRRERRRLAEGGVDGEEGVAPFVVPDLVGDRLAHCLLAQEVDDKVVGIDVGGDDSVHGDLLAAGESHLGGLVVVDDDVGDEGVRADLATVGLEVGGEGGRDAVHPSLDDADTDILDARREQPRELAATDVVG